MWLKLHKIYEEISKAFFEAVTESGFGGLANLATAVF
jgi:hypothetical protein